jgi:hypothetical protein
MNRRTGPSIDDLARQVWGEATSGDGDELRFGSHGSKSVKVSEGKWYDFETGEGGGYTSLFVMANGRGPTKGAPRGGGKRDVVRPPKLTPQQRVSMAATIWEATRPAPATRVERYLRARGVTLAVPPVLRYHSSLWHRATNTHWPAMVAEVLDRNGNFVAVHRTYLHHLKPTKAPVDGAKLSLGHLKEMGAAIRLAPAGPVMIVGEGIETVLSVMQEMQLPGWAAIACANMAAIDLPYCVKEVLIAADGDEPGELWANRAAWRWEETGLHVRIMQAPPGFDFNDVLMGRC